MLDKETFTFKMNEMLMAFPSWQIKYDDPETMRFWHYKFKNMDNNRFVHMVDSYVDNEDFPPTIGKLRKQDRKSTRLNSSHVSISYAVFCLKKKKKIHKDT